LPVLKNFQQIQNVVVPNSVELLNQYNIKGLVKKYEYNIKGLVKKIMNTILKAQFKKL
jgi:hypothetical protein